MIDLSVHLLYSCALNEEGLFRIPGSSVKIKKLKNAINAWYVTLASQRELENEQQNNHQTTQSRSSGQSGSVLAIYDLFKEIVGQSARTDNIPIIDNPNHNIHSSTATFRDDSKASQISGNQQQTSGHCTLFDCHSISGLLKCYLRELPEPLFTHDLYQQWVDVTTKPSDDDQTEAYAKLVEKLPKANYDNLSHLIKFLYLLTCHREHNKMTATNLAIAMAPSLIWTPPQTSNTIHNQQGVEGSQQVPSCSSNPSGVQMDDMQALNMQMLNVGISASLHAQIIENLIVMADKLFPQSVQFTLPHLDDLASSEIYATSRQQCKGEICETSESPSGLSTASSSSFSSASHGSPSPKSRKKHDDSVVDPKSRPIGNDQPSSLDSKTQKDKPPPVPPAPVVKNHLRHVSDTSTSVRPSLAPKPPAPRAPPSCSLRRQQPVETKTKSQEKAPESPVPVSLRGTGSLRVSSGTSNALRPSVPPPTVPTKASGIDDNDTLTISNLKNVATDLKLDNVDSNKGPVSPSSSVNMKAEFEEINSADVEDELDIQVSPVVSIGSLSIGDDSSFENDCVSLEHSWTECVIVQEDLAKEKPTEVIENQPHSDLPTIKAAPRLLLEKQLRGQQSNQSTSADLKHDRNPTLDIPPVKPPRSVSPKVTQSTPL